MRTRRTATMLGGGLLLLAGGAVAHPCFGTPQQRAAVRDAAFREADADGSGTLDEGEFAVFHEAVRRAMTRGQFKRADADGDGKVTRDELERWRAPRAGRGRWRGRP